MLRVRLEYVPFGDESLIETLETVEIVNDGTRLGSGMGDYDVTHRGNYEITHRDYGGAYLNRARVVGHVRSDGALVLVRLALAALEDKHA
jgi:hypothetical protein